MFFESLESAVSSFSIIPAQILKSACFPESSLNTSGPLMSSATFRFFSGSSPKPASSSGASVLLASVSPKELNITIRRFRSFFERILARTSPSFTSGKNLSSSWKRARDSVASDEASRFRSFVPRDVNSDHQGMTPLPRERIDERSSLSLMPMTLRLA